MTIPTIHDTTVVLPSFLDPEDDRSMVNIAPKEIRHFIRNISPETFKLKDRTLKNRAKPDFVAKCLRINFWHEYSRAQENTTDMRLDAIIRGVTHKTYFLHIAETEPFLLAWIITPPMDYAIMQEEIFMESLLQMKKILNIDPIETTTIVKETDKGTTTTTKKSINTSVLEQKRKVMESMADRMQGTLTKKIALTGTMRQELPTVHPRLLNPNALEDLEAEIMGLK